MVFKLVFKQRGKKHQNGAHAPAESQQAARAFRPFPSSLGEAILWLGIVTLAGVAVRWFWGSREQLLALAIAGVVLIGLGMWRIRWFARRMALPRYPR